MGFPRRREEETTDYGQRTTDYGLRTTDYEEEGRGWLLVAKGDKT